MATSEAHLTRTPPDDLEGTVRWVYHEKQKPTWTNTWDRLICRPKAYELGISGIISAVAPKNDEFLLAVKDFRKTQSQNFSTETHFVNRGVQWGWRYDKGISAIQLGRSIQVVAVLPKDTWIASRTDTAAFKRLSDDEKRRQNIQVERLEKQLLEGTWKQSGLIRESSPIVYKPADYKQVQIECIKCFQKIGATAEFTKEGNIIRCMSDLATPDWPNDWIEWVVQNAGQIIKGVEIDK